MSGDVAFVLHTHLPYLRGHGVWPVGEEWLFQAWAGSWLPVTRVLERLAEDGHRDVLTLGVTPLVAHQVRDAGLARDLGTWIAGQMWRSEEQRWHTHMGPEVVELATWYWRRFAGLLAYHEDVESRGGLTAVWAELAAAGVVELLGGPATHPYLPLLPDPAEIDAQLAVGLEDHAGWAGARPAGVWPPELGYRPRAAVADPAAAPVDVERDGTPRLPRLGVERPGLEDHYARHGIGHVLVDTATLWSADGRPERDWVVDEVLSPSESAGFTLLHEGVLVGDSEVAAFARDVTVSAHVWSSSAGYPADPWYRDYFAHGTFGTHPSWRVTDRSLPPDGKAPYVPDAAAGRVHAHADHFLEVVRDTLATRDDGVVVTAFDTELFGHWWFEGPDWLDAVLRRVADTPGLRTTTLASRRGRRPPTSRRHLPEGSWGHAKSHVSWVTDATRPMWQALADARATARASLAGGRGTPAQRRQVARELALLATSDWPYMVVRGNAPGYADERVRAHGDAIHRLCDRIDRGEPDDAEVVRLAALDTAPADVGPLLAALDPAGPEAHTSRSRISSTARPVNTTT